MPFNFATTRATTQVLIAQIIFLLLTVISVGLCSAPAHAQEAETLTLEQFRGYKQEAIGSGWKSIDGTIEFDGSGGGDIITKESYKNFELTLEWRISEGGNSGIMYRVGLGDGAPYFTGPEYQILDDEKHQDGNNEMTSAGSLYAMYKPTGKTLQSVGQWNKTKIVVDGNHVEHWLNDTKVVDADWGSDDWKDGLVKVSSQAGKNSPRSMKATSRYKIMATKSRTEISQSSGYLKALTCLMARHWTTFVVFIGMRLAKAGRFLTAYSSSMAQAVATS